MSVKRKKLQEALCRYTTDTLNYIDTVRGFCDNISTWMLGRETELQKMIKIKDRLNNKDSERADLVKELEGVLKVTLKGLEELDCFLDAVEKLAVTSLHVFMEDNQVLDLPRGISLKQVQNIIAAARLICPLLLEFKRDASFFLPKLQNVEVLSFQLNKYIQTTQKICDEFQKSCVSDFDLKMTKETVAELDEDFSEDDMQKMLHHINQLDELRRNQHFRTVFLFHEDSCSEFIREFSERQPRMLQFLKDLEEAAVQLDRMNKRAKISSVAGSSVGAVGGVLSTVGLALLPVTAGLSTGLIMGGTALGVTSGVNSAVTTLTEMGVNRTQKNKANEVFQSFMEDVQVLQGCLEDVTSQTVTKIETSELDVAVGGVKVLNKVHGIVKYKNLVGGKVAQGGKALRNVSRMASEVPDVGQAAVKGSLALTKAARAGLITLNALFIGMDVFFICKDSISLSKGSETEVSQFIRARAALWRSQIDSWRNMLDSLNEGLPTSREYRAIFDKIFYPEREICTKVQPMNRALTLLQSPTLVCLIVVIAFVATQLYSI